MILCDIGNTHFHFWCDGKVFHIAPKNLRSGMLNEEIYYISVNVGHERLLNKIFKNTYNLEPIINLKTAYVGLGVDRKAACIGAGSGVVVDAGSAISVDIVVNNYHRGGYLLPGLSEFIASYNRISPALDTNINFGLEPNELPNNTKDAITYGLLRSIILNIRDSIGTQKAFFTGGDGKYLAKFFPKAVYDETLIFRGMRTCIQLALEERRKKLQNKVEF